MDTTKTLTVKDTKVQIRPIRSDDTGLQDEFYSKLSVPSRHYRFLAGVGALTASQLKRMCEPDSDKECALVALIDNSGVPEQIGVTRFFRDESTDAAEFAIVVMDNWQQQGLGSELLGALVEEARHRGIRELYSIDAADNAKMRQLAADFKMSRERNPDDPHEIIHKLAVFDDKSQNDSRPDSKHLSSHTGA